MFAFAVWLLATSGSVWAEGYTVQTIAVREVERARSIVATLRTEGFDAYTESVVREGVRWHRVRVGCFTESEEAEDLAVLLRGGITAEAVVVDRTLGAPHDGCIVRDVGFVAPDAWLQRAPGVAAFDVTVAGVEATLRYADGRWQVLQASSRPTVTAPTRAAEVSFVQRDAPVGPFVMRLEGRLERPVCAGTLLAEVPDAVVVEHAGVVSACRLDETVERVSP